jgi:ATP-dependent Clp protease ATP-binding subunit ClpA
MLFPQGVFAPELVADSRARAALAAAADRAPEPLHAGDFVAAALGLQEPGVLAVFSRALQPGCSAAGVLAAFSAFRGAIAPGAGPKRPRHGFSPPALRALDEFAAVLLGSGGALDGVALELLLHFALSHLTDAERQALPGLDARRAAALFRDQAARAIDPRAARPGPPPGGGPAEDAPFRLPPQLAASDDLTHRARTAEAAAEFPFDGEPRYERLFDALARALHRRPFPHALLVGERGVGKSTVVAELARRAAAGRVPFLAPLRFVAVDCRYVPPDESRQRLAAVLSHVADRPDLVACLEGFPALLRGERASSNKPVLMAALAHARCRVVGLATPRECDELLSDDPDFAEFFTRVDAEEPDPDVALRLLRHFALGLSDRFRVAVDDEAVRRAVALSADFILNDQLPAKALKLLHRACEEVDYERGQLGRPRDRVTADDVVRLVAEVSGVPEETLRGVAGRSDYEQGLREMIFGQDHAVREVATELGLIKAGMTDPTKPASVMLFLGQTGTGKTELAKALARLYSTSKRLKTYTLGNCVEAHSVSTIIGVPPGYVGHDQGGRLVNELNADPYCVFLLDEADKAHPDVLQPFLNLFDEGWVCDQRGARAYGNKSIFILTSNVGQRMIAEMVQQGKPPEEIAGRMKEALSQIRHSKSDRPVFTPEFLARIKRVIVFNPLGRAAMEGIARKLTAELAQSWAARRSKRLDVPDALALYIAEQGHRMDERSGGKEGGRIIRKLLSEWVEARLQREASLRPEEYKRCSAVALEFTPPPVPPETAPVAPAVSVSFR